ncbi:hypothetical protein AgCh_020822 [Apium graveolens]
MEKVGGFEIELFNGRNNFTLWQSTVKDLLIQRGLYATLGGKKPTKVDDTKWGDMKLRAASTNRLALAPEIKYDVLEEDNPKNLWEKLTKTYHSKYLANKLFLKKDLFGLKMEEDGDLRDHLNRFNGLINQLNNLDEKLKDEDKVVLLLVSLPKKYNTVMTSLLVGKTKLDLDETIVVQLEAERLMKQESSDTSDGSAFVATEDLRELKKNRGGSVLLVETDEDVLLVQEEKGSKEEWVLDSGCSHQICGRREWFSSYKKCEGKIVTLPNGKTVKVAGIVDLGYTVMMKNSMLKVTKGDLEILKEEESNKSKKKHDVTDQVQQPKRKRRRPSNAANAWVLPPLPPRVGIHKCNKDGQLYFSTGNETIRVDSS